MKISFFGSLAEAIGREIDVPVAAGATVGKVRRLLAERHPEAAAALLRPTVRAFIGDVIATEETALSEGNALAFLPPLSGG